MRLLVDGHCLDQTGISGVQRYTAELLHAFEALGISHRVARPPVGGRLRRHLWLHRVLPGLAKDSDVLLCPGNMGPWRMSGSTKLVLVLHSLAFLEIPQAYSWAFRSYYRHVIPRVLGIATRVLTVTEAERARLVARFPWIAGKVEVVPLGVAPVFRLDAGQASDVPRILYVGSMGGGKGLEVLGTAFLRLIDRIPHRLTIAGAPKHFLGKADLAVLGAIPTDRLELLGEIADQEVLASWYRRSDLLVLPSRYESFGLPALEAMACGTPVVASSLPALQEVCGPAAVYVPAGDPAELADAMTAVLGDPLLRRAMREQGIERARRFTWEACARRTHAACAAACAAPGEELIREPSRCQEGLTV